MILEETITSFIIVMILQYVFYYLFSDLYKNKIEQIQKSKWKGFFISYDKCFSAFFAISIVIFGLNYFIIDKRKPVYEAILYTFIISAFFNCVCYSAFDEWSGLGAILDVFWACILIFITTSLVYMIFSKNKDIFEKIHPASL
jgi:cytochrome bd-type quinol oxidase subunit 2